MFAGCVVYNINHFVIPDDQEFLETIEKLENPGIICNYMANNFVYEKHFNSLSPYQLWKTKKGDCNDFSNFATFVADYHGYETYQIWTFFKEGDSHMLGVFVVNGKYDYSSNWLFYHTQFDTFIKIVDHNMNYYSSLYELKSYKVYDYGMNLVEVG